MTRARAVAGLAGNIELRPGRLEGIALRIIVALQVGRVAIRAHEIPVLERSRPVEQIIGGSLVVGIEDA